MTDVLLQSQTQQSELLKLTKAIQKSDEVLSICPLVLVGSLCWKQSPNIWL